jgi:DNA-binding response OmpR family regulator
MRTAVDAILIVSARPELADRIAFALHRVGLASCIAVDAAEAVRHLTESPLAVVLDLEFDDMEPEQIVRRAVACPETHRAPILGIGSTPEENALLLDAGCTAVLHRDVAPRAVAEAIRHLVDETVAKEDGIAGCARA